MSDIPTDQGVVSLGAPTEPAAPTSLPSYSQSSGETVPADQGIVSLGPPTEPAYPTPLPKPVQARVEGHSWDDINQHVAEKSAEALQAGYSPEEIDNHLGYNSAHSISQSSTAHWASALSDNPDAFSALNKPLPDFSLDSPSARDAYSTALLSGNVKGPQDFGDHFSTAAANLIEGHQDSPLTDEQGRAIAGAMNGFVNALPREQDLTDAALSVGGAFDITRRRLMDHWQETGEAPLAAASRGENDIDLRQKLSSPPNDIYGDIHTALGVATSYLGTAFEQAFRAGGETGTAIYSGQNTLTDLAQYFSNRYWTSHSDLSLLGYIATNDLDKAVKTLAAVPGFYGAAAWGLLDSLIHPNETTDPKMIANDVLGIANSFPLALKTFGVEAGPGGIPLALAGAALEKILPRPASIETPKTVEHIDLSAAPGEQVQSISPDIAFKPPTPAARSALPEGTVETPKPQSFPPDATPAEKIEALAKEKLGMQPPGEKIAPKATRLADLETENREARDEFSNPNLFRNLAKDEDPATQELAKSYDDARAFADHFRAGLPKLMQDLLKSEEGTVYINAEGIRRFFSKFKEDENSSFAISLMRASANVRELQTAQLATRLEPYIVKQLPFLKEYQEELDKLSAGDKSADPMGTTYGKLINWLEGVDPVGLGQDHPLFPLYHQLKDLSKIKFSAMQAAVDKGIIDKVGYIEDYVRHNWREPKVQSGEPISVVGSFSSFMERSKKVPTMGDGIRLGLIPKYPDLIQNFLADWTSTLKAIQDAEIRQRVLDAGKAKWSSEIAPPELGWKKLVGVRNTRDLKFPTKAEGQQVIDEAGIPKYTMLRQQLWAEPRFARFYNYTNEPQVQNLLGTNVPLSLLRNGKNTLTAAYMLLPLFHTVTELQHVYITALGTVEQEVVGAGKFLIKGEPINALKELGHAAKDTALGLFKPITLARLGRTGQIKALRGEDFDNDAIRLLTENGMRWGRRQEIYQTGHATSLIQSITRGLQNGESFGEKMTGIGRMLKNDVPNPLAHPFQASAWVATQMSAPLFDVVIPYLKQGVVLEQAQTFLRQNPFVSEELRDKRFRQIIDNTDYRMGEVNSNNLFWHRWVNATANIAMLSTSWVYGEFMNALSGIGIRLQGRTTHLEWNPVAFKSIMNLAVVAAGFGALYSYFKTGHAPRNPMDYFFPRTTTGTAVNLPGAQKEFYDWWKIYQETRAAFEDVGPTAAGIQFFDSLKRYGEGKLASPVKPFDDFMNAKDAIGHPLGYGPYGLSWLAGQTFKPIPLLSIENAKDPSITPLERSFGVREAAKIIQDYPKWRSDVAKAHEKTSRGALHRWNTEHGLPNPRRRGRTYYGPVQ